MRDHSLPVDAAHLQLNLRDGLLLDVYANLASPGWRLQRVRDELDATARVLGLFRLAHTAWSGNHAYR